MIYLSELWALNLWFHFFSTTWQSTSLFKKIYWLWKKVSNKWVVKWVAAQRGRVKVNSTTLFTIHAEIHILFWYKTSSYIFYRLKGAERKHAMKGCLTETCQHSKAFLPFFTNRRHPTNQFIFFLVGSILRINPSVL